MAKTRTFIALGLHPQIRQAASALIDRLRPAAGDRRWVAEENLHFTLHFLGDLTDQEVAEVCERVGAVCAKVDAFSLAARGLGAFPSVERPHTIWIGAGQGSDDVLALHGELDAALADMGFRGENRKYVPHITLGRTGRSRGGDSREISLQLAEQASCEIGVMAVEEVIVYASLLRSEGPEYHVLSRCSLRSSK